MVSIVLLAHNQLEFCRACLASLQRCTTPPYKLILVDNGSTDGVGELFDATANATVVHTGRNLGFAQGTNLGLSHVDGHALLLNSDTLLTPGWLERLLSALESDRDIGLAGPVTNRASGHQQLDNVSLDSEAAIEQFAAAVGQENAGQIQDTSRLVAFCLLIRDRALKELGPLDSRFGVGNFEDDDYCIRARLAGWRMVIAQDCFVFHYGGRTFAGIGYNDESYRALVEQNEALLREKWRGLDQGKSETAVRMAEQVNAAAAMLLQSAETTRALRLLRLAANTWPWYARNFNDLGLILWRLDQLEAAKRCFQRALMLEPESEYIRQNARLVALEAPSADPNTPSGT